MKSLLAYTVVISLNLILSSYAQAKVDCPNFQGSYASAQRIYGEDLVQVEVYQSKCSNLSRTFHQFRGGMNLTDPVVHNTDGVWKEDSAVKLFTGFLADRFVTISSSKQSNSSLRETWTVIDGHIRVENEMIKGFYNDPAETIPAARIISKQTYLYARLRNSN